MQRTQFHRLTQFLGAGALLASAAFLGSQAFAQATGGPSAAETTPPGASKPPAKEAIDACVGKAEGDRVTFTDAKNKKRKWVCATTGGVLAARSGIATAATKVKPK